LALRRLALSCAWVGIVQSQLIASTGRRVQRLMGVDVIEGMMGGRLRGGVNGKGLAQANRQFYV